MNKNTLQREWHLIFSMMIGTSTRHPIDPNRITKVSMKAFNYLFKGNFREFSPTAGKTKRNKNGFLKIFHENRHIKPTKNQPSQWKSGPSQKTSRHSGRRVDPSPAEDPHVPHPVEICWNQWRIREILLYLLKISFRITISRYQPRPLPAGALLKDRNVLRMMRRLRRTRICVT